jgi:hypothetical protein
LDGATALVREQFSGYGISVKNIKQRRATPNSRDRISV